MATLNIYSNNLARKPGQVLIECDPNRTVLKLIEACITKNNSSLSNEDLARWIFLYFVSRIKNHVVKVQACATYLRPFFQQANCGNLFNHFITKVQQHDFDKFSGNEHVTMYALHSTLMMHRGLYKMSDRADKAYHTIELPKHWELNDHHPEHYMKLVDTRKDRWAITDDEFDRFYAGHGGYAAIVLAIAEMVADWSAVGLDMGNTAKEWWLKNQGVRWSYGPKYTDLLEECLEHAPTELYVNDVEPLPEAPSIRTISVEDSSPQLSLEAILTGEDPCCSEDLLDGSELSEEKLFISDKETLAAVKSATKVATKTQLATMLQPGDMILTYRKMSKKTFVGKIKAQITSHILGSSFGSIKMVAEDGQHVYGYGLKMGLDHVSFDRVSVNNFFSTCSGMLVLRNPKLTTDQKKRLFAWLSERVNKVDYSNKMLIKSIFTHLLKLVTGNITPEEAKNYFRPMFCSTIFAYAMKACNIETGLSFGDASTVWPRDWAVHSNWKPLYSYIDPAEDTNHYMDASSTSNESEDTQYNSEVLSYMDAGLEKLFISDPGTLQAVRMAIKVPTKKRLAELLLPGDMILTYRKRNKMPLMGKINATVISHVLGSSFSSIKMVAADGKHVYGYCLKFKMSFDKVSVSTFLSTCYGCLVLRNPNLKKSDMEKMDKWMAERVGKVDYSTSNVVKSAIAHIFKLGADIAEQSEAQKYFKPMFCSTIFAYAMLACGVDSGLGFSSITYVWPKDWATKSNWKSKFCYLDPTEYVQGMYDKTMIASAASYVPEVQGEYSAEGWGDPVTEQGMCYKIRNFPADQFLARLHKEYGTTRLDHLIQILGITFFVAKTRTIVIHKFFIPELLYLLDKFQFPPSVSDMIRNNTWVGAPVTITQTVDTAYIAKTMNAELYDHQKAFIESYATNRATNHLRGYILSFEQGLGKTITALALMQGLKKDHVVIICPKNTMIETWQNHLTKFFNEPQSVWIAGSSSTPPTAAYKWFIVNYERIEEVSKFLLKSGFSNLGVIVDESHNFLRTSSQRTQLLIDLSKNNKNADILLQSGTPVKCTGIELVPLLYVLDPYFDAEALAIFKRTFKLNTTIANDVLNARLKRMMTRVTKDILDLPEKQEVVVKIKMKTGSKYTVTQVQKDVVEFVKQRRIYYNQHLKEYVAAFEEVISYLKRDPKFSRSADFKRYLRIVDELRNSTTVNVRDNPDIAWANQYEREVIIPALPQDLKKKFLWSKSAVKYVSLKITGEVIGQLLTNLRIQMTSELMVAANLAQYVEGAMKKTVVFTSYVDTIELAYNYFKENGYSPIAIYSKTASELTENVRRFQEDTNLNPLIASLKMLSTGATLTAANTVIFLNKPWRSIEYQQASDRVHRIGQDTDCVIISLVLDTGKEGNLSTRMEDIMNWSADQFQQIVEEQVVDKDELAQVKQLFRGFAGLEYMPDDCIESEYSVEAYDPPYTEEQMRQNGYSEEVIARLKSDNAHAWRMKTGIELMHVEPTKSELMRIWKNWQQMSSSQKKQSDEMCMHLFGQNNKSLYEYLLPQYKTEQPGYGVVRYPFEVMIQGGYVYHASPLKVDKLRGKFTGAWSGEQGNVFVTQFKGIASCFVVNKDLILQEAERQLGGRLDNLNFSYDRWNLPLSQLQAIPKEIVCGLNVRGITPFELEHTGYLYKIDYFGKYRGHTHMFNKGLTSDVQFMIEGDVDYVSYEKVTVKVRVESSEEGIKRHGEAVVIKDSTEAASSDDKTRGPISEADRKKIGKYIYHGTHRDLDIKSLAIHVCKHRANPEITAPVVYMNRTLGVASLHAVPFMIGHGSKLSNYQEHFVNLDEAISSSTPLKQVEIVHNDPSLEECSGETTGYIYWVEAKEFLDDLYYATPKDPNDWNFVAYRPLPVAKKTKVTVKWHKKYDPEFASKVKSGHASVESLSYSAEASSSSKIAQKKKKILDYICKLCDTMEPSGVNSKRYQQIIGHMNDKEFDQFMNYMKEGKWQLHIVAPNMVINLKNEDLLKACDLIGLDLFQRVWMHDFTTGRKYLTDNKYMFVKLPVRRQQQFLDEKLSVPDNDRTIDGLTGQVTGDSRACSLTNPEIHILAARGLDHTLKELVNIRGGNIHGYGEFRRMLEENGEGDLDRVDPNSRTRSAVVGGVLLQAMMLGTNL